MKLDIGTSLDLAMTVPWNLERARRVLQRLAVQTEGATVDWDEGAGENWARVLVGTRVRAFVWMKGRLVIAAAVPEDVVAELHRERIVVLQVPDMDSECFCADRSAITGFAGRPISEALNEAQFSAEELVWATL